MTDRPRKTLQQMQREADGQPMTIAGKPADVCPYCGCAMFAHGTQTLTTRIDRYVHCRNDKCGRRFLSRQPPAVLVREVGGDEISSSGIQQLTVFSDSA